MSHSLCCCRLQGVRGQSLNPWAPGVGKGCRPRQDSGGPEPTPGSRGNPGLYLNEEAAGLGRQVGVPQGQRAMKQEAMTSKRFKFKKRPPLWGLAVGVMGVQLWLRYGPPLRTQDQQSRDTSEMTGSAGLTSTCGPRGNRGGNQMTQACLCLACWFGGILPNIFGPQAPPL